VREPTNFLTLHREPDRHRYLAASESRDAFLDAATRTWIVTKPSHCRELIASGNLRPATYVEDYAALEQRLGVDFSSLTFAFSHIPLCLDGEPHRNARRRVSEFLATRKAALHAGIPKAVATHFGRFAQAGRIEVMGEVIQPFVLEIISTMIDIEISTLASLNASIIFDRSLGIPRRRKVAADIAGLRDLVSARAGEDATEDDIGMRLALVILGRDALIGTLGESLYRLLNENPGRLLGDIGWPELPPETGVPFIERVVVTPFDAAGASFAAGDRVRIVLQSFAYAADPKSRTTFFGAGAHACLGRPVSLDVWRALTGFLSQIPLRASVLSYAVRTSDYVFTCPDRLEVDLYR
jgi:cytochrome P450